MKIDFLAQLQRTTSLQMQLLLSHFLAMLLGAGTVLISNLLYRTHWGEVLKLLFAGILTVVFTSVSSGQIIVQPLKKLEQTMRSFADGDLEEEVLTKKLEMLIGLRTAPELRRLSLSFNYLARKLQGSEKRRQEFVENLVHEIRTPVSTIHANLKLIQTDHAALIGEPIVWMLDETQRLKQLATDTLQLSPFESGQLPVRFQKFAMQSILKELISSASAQCGSPCQLRLAVPAELPKVYADPERVKQILVNLLNNALTYTPQGIITLCAWAETDRLWLAVMDTGIGIADSDLSHVFDRSWRSEQSRQINPEGKGIGLSLTQWLVELQGGRIDVESQLGKGSTFRFSLQLA